MVLVDYLEQMWTMALNGEAQGIFFFVVLYAFFVVGYSAVKQVLVLLWPSTTGLLESAEVRKVGLAERLKSTQDFVAAAVYHYSVDGVEYEGSQISTRAMLSSRNARFVLKRHLDYVREKANGELAVYYHPKKPAESILIKPSKLSIVFAFSLALLPICIYFREYQL